MKSKPVTIVILSGILIFAAILRFQTFFAPHSNGDQVYYVGLAMKMEREGLDGYNLRGIDTGLVKKDGSIVAVIPSKAGTKGSLLEGLEKSNVLYYSKEKLSNMPPAYSFLIMLSHSLFKRGSIYTLSNLPKPKVRGDKTASIVDAQFYSVWISFIFSLLFIILVFFLGKELFNDKIGLMSAFIIACAPLDILTSQRIWADEMLSFFVALSVLFFIIGKKRENLLFIVLSGFSAGIASLTKASGLFIIPVVCSYVIIMNIRDKRPILDKGLFIFTAAAMAAAFFWYLKITIIYGAPWYAPRQEGIEYVSSWFYMLSRRPVIGQFLYFIVLSPVFILFYLEAALTFVKRIFTNERILLLIWFFTYAAILTVIGGKEERYMLPAYPAIGILTAGAIERIMLKFNKNHVVKYSFLALVCLLLGGFAVHAFYQVVMKNISIFPIF